ncbi:MAG: hypothetical protein ACREBH_02025 [Candidatus Micrarchaeaceae archaeon]
MEDIDDLVYDQDNEEDHGPKGAASANDDDDELYSGIEVNEVGAKDRVEIGTVEHFFSKIGVAAIKITGSLKVGDSIEIEDDNGTVAVRISSMQIDRKDVSEATEGDSIGVKVDKPVSQGSIVYFVANDADTVL